jgi:hypothetical protein
MGDPVQHDRGTKDRRTGDARTTSRTGADPRTAPPAAPITVTVPVDGWRDKLLTRLEGAIGIRSRTIHQPERRLGRSASPFADYDDFHEKVGRLIMNFRARANRKTVTLYFTLPRGVSWSDVRRTPTLLYTHVTVRHELQVEDEHRAEVQRGEEELRAVQDERRATAARLERDAARERARARAAPKIKELAQMIRVTTMYWTVGSVRALYANGEFTTIYGPLEAHQIHARAMGHAASPDVLARIERALWDAFWQEGRWQVVYEVPPPRPQVAEPPPPPSGGDVAVEDCEALLRQGRHREWEQCLKRRRRRFGKDIQEGAMRVTEPAAAVLEAVNPLDPVNMVLLPVGLLGIKGVSAVIKALRARRGFGVVFTYRSGAPYRFLGVPAEFAASRHGHHVYEYLDKEGKLLYVGKSGGVTGHADWVQRIGKDHRYTDWIGEAHLVRVTNQLTEQEMWALEQVLIPSARYNKKGGDYASKFPHGDVSANAASALRQPNALFIVETDPVRVRR